MFNPRLRELRWDVALLEEYTVPSSRAGPKYRVTGQLPCPKPTSGSLLTPSPSSPGASSPLLHHLQSSCCLTNIARGRGMMIADLWF